MTKVISRPLNYSYLVNYHTFIKFCTMKHYNQGHSGNAVYGLGLIGAAIYFISEATGFWAGVVGFLKALVWPAFLVYEAFKYFAG